MSVTLVNNSPQLTVATAGTRGLTGAHVVNAEFSGSDLIITLSDGTVVNAGGAILSSSGSNNWVGQQAVNGNVIVTGSFILSGSNTLINIGPASFSGSVNISGSTTITGSLIVSGGTINVIGTNLISASQGVTLANTTGYSTFSSSISQSISHSVANLSSSVGSLSGSVAGTIDSKFAIVSETNSTFVSRSIFNTFATSSNGRITSLEGESSNIRVTLNSYTQSQGLTNLRYEASQSAAIQSASLFNVVSASYVISASSLQGSASAQSTRISIAENRLHGLSVASGALQQFSQSVSAVTNSLQIATASLFTSASSLNISASNHENRLDAIENISSSWGASTNVNGLNTFATSSLASITALQSTASILVAYTTSSDNDINNLEVSASSLVISASSLRTSASTALSTNNSQASSITALNTFSASVNASGSIVNTFTSSVNSFSASVSNSLDSLTTISASLLTSASSLETSASSLRTSSSNAAGKLNSIEFTTESLNTYSSSLKAAIDVADGNLTVIGNLTVQGDTTTLNATNLIVEDKLIVIASGSTDSTDANGAGIYIEGADAYVSWSSVRNRMEINKNLHISGNITLGGLVDGTDIVALSSSFHTTSGSYNSVSGAINTIINGLNNYTSSSGVNISNLNTISSSYLSFTQSYYSSSASMDDRVTDLEASIGGGGTGIATRVTALEVSASQSAATNNLQTNIIAAAGTQIGQLNSSVAALNSFTASSTNVQNRLVLSASSLFESASSLRTSASNAFTNIQSQNTSIGSINNFTQSFTAYSASVSESIRIISGNLGGVNVPSKINSLENITGSFLIFQNSFISGNGVILSTGSRIDNLESTASGNRLTVRSLVSASDSYIAFSSSTFPQYTAATTARINEVSNSLDAAINGLVSDNDQLVYSESVAVTTYNLYTASLYLSQSVWANTWTPSGSVIAIPGLSRSINLKIQDISGSFSTRINTIVIGTGFIERPEFNSVTSSFSASISASNAFSASVTRSVNNNVLSASALQTTASNLSSYTSSLQLALQPNGVNLNVSGNLFVSGNIIAKQYIVSSSEIYITTSFSSGSNVFGNDYGDEHFFSGSVKMFGPLVMREGLLGANGNQTTFIDISGSITSSGQLKVNGITSSFISASTFVSASNFYGEYNGLSTQVHLSQSIGYNSLTASISGAINAASNSLSASVTTTIDTLSGSVDILFTSASSLRISASANRNDITFLYTSASSLETSASLLSIITSASIVSGSANQQSGSANKQSGSVLFTSASSLQLSASALQTSASVMITSASNLSTYTHSLQQAISVTGSNLRLLGNVNISNDLIVSGNIVAQNYIVSSSVTYMTTSFSSGSTTFGNDVTDNHNFTGSVYVVGSISSSATITAATHSGFILANNAVVSSSTQFVEYGALLTSSNSGKQAVSGTLIVSGTTSLTGSTIVNLVGVQSGSFRVQNGTTQIDSVLLVSNNDYVANGYVGGVVNVGDYIAGGNTAKFDGGVHISGSLRVLGNAQGSGSYFTGSVQITGNEAVSGNLQVVGNTSVSGNFIGTTISASSTVTASSLRVEGLTRINGEFDVDNTTITLGAGGNAVADETRLNTLNLRVDSDTFFNSNITAISGSTRVKSLGINDLSESRIPYVDSTDTLIDNANFTYNGVTFKIGGGRFEVDDATGNIRTSGSLSVGALNISNNLNVAGAVGIQSTLTVTGSTLISSSLRVTNTASIAHLVVTGSTTITGSANISGNLSVGGTSRVSGNFAVSGTLDISGSATFDSYVNITGGLAVTGGFSAKGAPILLGDESTDRTIISGTLELSGSYYRNTTDIKSARSPLPIETLTQAQAWSSSFTTPSSASGAFIRTPDEFLEVFVGQGSNQRRYVMPVWLDETLYADDYFDISVVDGADSDYVY